MMAYGGITLVYGSMATKKKREKEFFLSDPIFKIACQWRMQWFDIGTFRGNTYIYIYMLYMYVQRRYIGYVDRLSVTQKHDVT